MISTASSDSKHVDAAAPSYDDCQQIAATLLKADELPMSCRRLYPELVRTILERRNSRPAGNVDPFEGMWSGAALQARSARSQGKEYHAQIQRRLTSTKR